MDKPNDENVAAATEHLLENLEKNGVVTAKMADGRLFLFSINTLHDLIDAALEKGSPHVSVFIKDDVSEVT